MVTKAPAPTPATKTAAKRRTPVKALETALSSTSVVDTLTEGTTLVHEIPIASIDPHPLNPRRELGDLSELAESIRAHGVKQPATVIPHPDEPGRYMTVIGHRRIAASTLADRTSVRCLVDATMSLADQLEVMLVENLQRQDLTPFEEGAGYQGLLDLGVTKVDISTRTGRSRVTIDQRLRIAPIDARFQARYAMHEVTLADAITLADIREADEKVYNGLIEHLDAGGKLEPWRIDSAHKEIAGRQKMTKLTADAKAAGIPVLKEFKSYPRVKAVDIKDLKIKPAAHKTCPGHALYLTMQTYNGAVSRTVVCTDGPTHHPVEWKRMIDGSGGPSRLSPEEQAALDVVNAALEEAGEARETWLGELFMIDSPEHAPVRAAAGALVAQLITSRHELKGSLPLDVEGNVTVPSAPLTAIVYAAVSAYAADFADSTWDVSRNVSQITRWNQPTAPIPALSTLAFMVAFGYQTNDGERYAIEQIVAALDSVDTSAYDVPQVLRDLIAAVPVDDGEAAEAPEVAS